MITSSCKWTGYHPLISPSIQLCFYQHAISINTFNLWIYSSAIRNTVTILCFVISCTISHHLKTNYILTIWHEGRFSMQLYVFPKLILPKGFHSYDTVQTCALWSTFWGNLLPASSTFKFEVLCSWEEVMATYLHDVIFMHSSKTHCFILAYIKCFTVLWHIELQFFTQSSVPKIRENNTLKNHMDQSLSSEA